MLGELRELPLLQDESGLQELLVDFTTVRAHQQGGAVKQVLGRSRGGLSSKLHLGYDALARPRQLVLAGGQVGACP